MTKTGTGTSEATARTAHLQDAGMDEDTYKRFVRVVYGMSGICLGNAKKSLVCARVGKRMRVLGLEDYGRYLRHVMADETGEEMVHFLDAISTNVTGFFREPEHFRFLNRLVRDWLAQGQRRFRFWSAGCSSGEEACSMTMVFFETAGDVPVDLRILATDISSRKLAECSAGLYKAAAMKPVPKGFRAHYFLHHREKRDSRFEFKPELRQLIAYRRLNLSNTPFSMRGPFDLIFCRNVMIYFDNKARINLLEEVHRLLRPGGYLIVGHAESLTGLLSKLKGVRPSIYRKE